MSDPRDYQRMEKVRKLLASMPSFERLEVLREQDEVSELIDAAEDVYNRDQADQSEEGEARIERLSAAACAFNTTPAHGVY